jgi:cytochrome c55X
MQKIMQKLLLFSLGLLLLLQLTAAQAFAPNNKLTAERKQQLIHLLKQDCGSCHGMTLKGGLGPALLPEDLSGKSLAFVINTITYGRPGTAMPPWQSLLTEQEIHWLSEQLLAGIK